MHEDPATTKRILARHRSVEHHVYGRTKTAAMERAARAERELAIAQTATPGSRERVLEQKRSYYQRNREKILASQRAYVQRVKNAALEQEQRTSLQQSSSWWNKTEQTKEICCPCCQARFVIVEGSKVKGQ